MPTQKTFWVCSFCSRNKSAHKSRVLRHENNCFKNPNRAPYFGELTRISQTGKIKSYGYQNYIQGEWLEWVEHEEMPAWWPGETGMIFDGERWVKVQGYSTKSDDGAHGCAGGGPAIEEWPSFNGMSLPEYSPGMRLSMLRDGEIPNEPF